MATVKHVWDIKLVMDEEGRLLPCETVIRLNDRMVGSLGGMKAEISYNKETGEFDGKVELGIDDSTVKGKEILDWLNEHPVGKGTVYSLVIRKDNDEGY